jgi:aryl-alcohol dehydrogenase-like predicted oxidoreductase
VLEIACSNFASDLIDEATKTAESLGTARFMVVENDFSLLRRQSLGAHASTLHSPPAYGAELFAVAERNDMGVIPYFPLASGMLTGKYRRGEEPPAGTRLSAPPEARRAAMFKAFRDGTLNDRNFDIVEGLEAFAAARGHTLLELSMSWLAGLPNLTSVIAGATAPQHVRANVSAVNWDMTAEDRAEIDRITLQ